MEAREYVLVLMIACTKLRFLRAIREARREDWFRANHPRMPRSF
jgi:hypothetical protein